jgi:hypothetical protein
VSPKVQQVAYVLTLLGLLATLAVGILADHEERAGARSVGINGSSKDS